VCVFAARESIKHRAAACALCQRMRGWAVGGAKLFFFNVFLTLDSRGLCRALSAPKNAPLPLSVCTHRQEGEDAPHTHRQSLHAFLTTPRPGRPGRGRPGGAVGQLVRERSETALAFFRFASRFHASPPTSFAHTNTGTPRTHCPGRLMDVPWLWRPTTTWCWCGLLLKDAQAAAADGAADRAATHPQPHLETDTPPPLRRPPASPSWARTRAG